MPRLVDTSIRLLSQEPLSAAMPTAELLRLAEILDAAGFSYLEVSGGGAFDAVVRRGIESPWERIRAIKAATKTPLMLAVRGAFLVGSRPHDALIETAQRLPEIGAARILLDDPAGLLQPHRAGELIAELREVSGLPVGLYAQGAGRNGLAVALEAARAGVDLIACAVYPVALATHRVTGEALAQALAGIGHETGVDVDTLWRAADLVDEHIGDMPISPLLPRVSVRAAHRKLPPGLVSIVDGQLRRLGHGDRLDDVLDEVDRVRIESGSPPLAAPIGQVIASQALVNVLGANRYATIVDELRELVLG